MRDNYNGYPSQIKSFKVRINHNGYPSPIMRIKDDDTTLVITYSPRNKVVTTRPTDSRSHVQQIRDHTTYSKHNEKKERKPAKSKNLKTRDLGKN